MTPDEVYQSLTDEQLDALLLDARGPGKQRLNEEKDRRASSSE